MTLALRYAVRSDVGLLREGNEDSAYAGPHLLAVADGMGGHAAGEVASAATITTLASLDAEIQGVDLVGALADAVASANLRLHELISSDPAIEGMGTTLTALLWSDGYAALCHIGDSRAYLLRGPEFVQVTHDHTLVQSLVDEGKISEDDVATHPHRSLLLRALDGRTVAEPDLNTIETLPGDRFLLCSDGLSGVVTEQTLRQTLNSVRDPDKAALQLVELAIRGGGPDNITVIVADVVDTQASPVPPTFTPVLAGAAASGGPTPTRKSSPATRAMRLTKTMPQPTVPDEPTTGIWPRGYRDGYTGTFEASPAEATNGFGSAGRATPGLEPPGFERTGFDGAGPAADEDEDRLGRRRAGQHARRNRYAGDPDDGDDAGDSGDAYAQRGRRRWPIVKMTLVLLVLLLAGGAYGAWWYNQRQYFVGQQNGNVAIFRGTNQSIAGISLSSVVSRSNLPVSQLGASDQGAIAQTISKSSLADAQALLATLQSQASQCRQNWMALVNWETQEKLYLQELAAAQKKRPKVLPTSPGQQPPQPDAANCASAAEYGITSGLPSQSGTTAPAPAVTTTPAATARPTTKATTKPTAKSSASPGKTA
jgi:PPM family protein phosphatase